MRHHRLSTLALASTALIALAGCTSATATPPSPPELVKAEAGKPFEIEAADGGVAKVSVDVAKYSKKLDKSLLQIPNMHEGYLLIDVDWETTSGTTVPSDASVIAHSDKGFSTIPELQEDGRLSTAPLAKGEKSKAKLAFALPKAPAVIEIGSPELKQRVEIAVKP